MAGKPPEPIDPQRDLQDGRAGLPADQRAVQPKRRATRPSEVVRAQLRKNGVPDELWAAPETDENARGPGLDMLLTKAAIEFQTLRSDNADMAVKRHCESLREAL